VPLGQLAQLADGLLQPRIPPAGRGGGAFGQKRNCRTASSRALAVKTTR
jgi:hypothetical protein